MVGSFPPPDFETGGGIFEGGSMFPGGDLFSGGLPGFTGGNAGPAVSEAQSYLFGGDVYSTMNSPFIVGGEGNTATGATDTGSFIPVLAVGGLIAWFLLRKK